MDLIQIIFRLHKLSAVEPISRFVQHFLELPYHKMTTKYFEKLICVLKILHHNLKSPYFTSGPIHLLANKCQTINSQSGPTPVPEYFIMTPLRLIEQLLPPKNPPGEIKKIRDIIIIVHQFLKPPCAHVRDSRYSCPADTAICIYTPSTCPSSYLFASHINTHANDVLI